MPKVSYGRPGTMPLPPMPTLYAYLTGFATPSEGAEPEEYPDALVRPALRAPDVLIEVVGDGPRVVHLRGRLRRNEQLREESLQHPPQDWTGIAQARKRVGQERG